MVVVEEHGSYLRDLYFRITGFAVIMVMLFLHTVSKLTKIVFSVIFFCCVCEIESIHGACEYISKYVHKCSG